MLLALPIVEICAEVLNPVTISITGLQNVNVHIN
jgi:hypothetical protein